MLFKGKGRCWASVFCLCTALGLAAQTASAAPLTSDEFPYPDGNLVGAGGWTAHSGAGSNPIQVASGQAVVVHGSGSREDANTTFAAQTGAVYYGIDISVDDLGVPYPAGTLTYFAHFKDAATNFRGRLFLAPPTGAGNYTVGISTLGGSADATWATDLTYGVAYRIVVKYDQDTNQAQLWVDATIESDTSILGADGTDPGQSMVGFALRQSSTTAAETIRVDNLCVATNFNEARDCSSVIPTGACVLPNTSCIITDATDCGSQGGSYLGDNAQCPTGACILPDTSCLITEPFDCTSQSGVYQGDNTTCPTGACTLPDTSCIITEQTSCTTAGGTYMGDNTTCPLGSSDLVINEVDADQAGVDTTEFVELYNTGASAIDFATSPHVLVFYNGSNDLSYRAIDLTGSVAAGDYYVVGSSDVANLDLDACAMVGMGCQDLIQNGADAVALYVGTSASFPANTPVTAASLVDAIVYDTADADDAGLLGTLTPGQPQIDEAAVDSTVESMQRCPDGDGGALNTGSYTTALPTPGAANCVPSGACVLMDSSCVFVTEASCTGMSGTYQGDGVTCPTGACVLPDTTCVITTGEDCGNQGGAYQGDASVCPTGACIVGSACTIVEPSECATLGGTYQGDGTMCPAATSTLLINEVDADQVSTDFDEFVEIYNAGGSTVDFAVTPHVLVFYNGSDNASYFAIDLTGSIAPGGFYVVGSSTVANLNLDFCAMVGMGCDQVMQNGADAVALYEGTTAVFPNGTAVTDASLVDALVYDTDDADDAELLATLTPGQAQINEDEANTGTTVSMQRCTDGAGGPRNTSAYVLRAPTPGTATMCSGACCLPNQTCLETDVIDCTAQGGAYKGDGSVCSAGLCDCQTIDELKLFGTLNTGYLLCNVTVVETVNQGGPRFGDRSFTVQDQSGVNIGPGGTERGMRIVGDVEANPALIPVFDALAEGDIVDVVGTLEDNNGMLYFRVEVPSNVTETGTGGVFNVPFVTAADFDPGSTTAENLESVRVHVTCLGFVNGGGSFLANATFLATDGGTTFDVRLNEVDNATMSLIGVTIPSDAVDLVGVFAQFNLGGNNYQLFLHESDDILAPSNCSGGVGACCLGDGTCLQTSFAICLDPQIAGSFVGGPCTPNPCIEDVGACCVEGVCTEGVTISNCALQGGTFLGADSTCANGCPDYGSIVINEIRIDQTGTDNDEYFELAGTPGASLDGLTYLVIGDSPSGTIEAVVPLDGNTIQADGLFLCAESTFGVLFPTAVVDLTANLNFENSDNVTHMLVANFTGNEGDNVDSDGDCVLNAVLPWSEIVDSIALVETPGLEDCYYGPAEIGPDGTFVPGHVYRCTLDPGGPWFIGPFDPASGVDTPDAPNACLTGACCFDGGARGTPCACPGNFDDSGASMGIVDLADVPGFVAALLTTGDNCADINGDMAVDGLDIAGMITRVINMESCVIAGCQQLSETDCTTMGGSFLGAGIACDPDPCGPIGACCDTATFVCDELTEAQCTGLFPGRTYKGDGTTCAADCQIDAINIVECFVQIDCSAVTQWCAYTVDQVDLAGSTCMTGLIQQGGVISIPCDGSCAEGPLTFRFDDGNGGVCIFSGTRFGGSPACNGSAFGSAFGIVP